MWDIGCAIRDVGYRMCYKGSGIRDVGYRMCYKGCGI